MKTILVIGAGNSGVSTLLEAMVKLEGVQVIITTEELEKSQSTTGGLSTIRMQEPEPILYDRAMHEIPEYIPEDEPVNRASRRGQQAK